MLKLYLGIVGLSCFYVCGPETGPHVEVVLLHLLIYMTTCDAEYDLILRYHLKVDSAGSKG